MKKTTTTKKMLKKDIPGKLNQKMKERKEKWKIKEK